VIARAGAATDEVKVAAKSTEKIDLAAKDAKATKKNTIMNIGYVLP
jgi:hypothetical protein